MTNISAAQEEVITIIEEHTKLVGLLPVLELAGLKHEYKQEKKRYEAVESALEELQTIIQSALERGL